MPDPTITIRLKTAADVAGAKAATEAVDAVTEAAQSATGALAPMTDASQGAAEALHETAQAAEAAAAGTGAVNEVSTQAAEELEELRKKVEELTKEMKALREGADDAGGGNAAGGGKGIKAFAEAIKAADGGVHAFAGRLPNLIGALGLGSGAVGVITIALMGLLKLINELKDTDFSGTWIGSLKDSVKEGVGAVSEFEAEMRAIIDAPDRWAVTGAEAAKQYEAAVAAALTAEIELLRARNAEMAQSSKLHLEELEHANRMAMLNKPSLHGSQQHTPEWAAREKERADMEFDDREIKRVQALDAAQAAAKAASDEERKQQEHVDTAHDRLSAIRGRDGNEKEMAKRLLDAKAARDEIQMMRSLPHGAGQTPAMMEVRAKLEERAEFAERKAEELRQKLAKAPSLLDGETPEQQQAAAKAEFERRVAARNAAADRRIETSGAAKDAERSYRNDGKFDRARLNKQKQEIDNANFMAEAERLKKQQEMNDPRNAKHGQMPAVHTAPHPAGIEGPAGDEIEAMQRDLRAKAQETGQPAIKAMLEEFARGLTDADGATAQELEQIRQLYSRLTSNKDESVALISNIVKALADAQDRTMGKVQADMAEVRARLEAMANRN